MRAENLSEAEQKKIKKDAEKIVGKKAKGTEIKLENDMISMLESECSKLVEEVEK